MKKTFTNKELKDILSKLLLFQKREQEYLAKTGKKLLTGKFNIAYAINKTRGAIESALKPYDKTLADLLRECSSGEAKKKGTVLITEERREEWEGGVKQLNEIEVEVEIYAVKLRDLEGIDLDSSDLTCLECMIE